MQLLWLPLVVCAGSFQVIPCRYSRGESDWFDGDRLEPDARDAASGTPFGPILQAQATANFRMAGVLLICFLLFSQRPADSTFAIYRRCRGSWVHANRLEVCNGSRALAAKP
jgi:hypothetical protein